MFVSLRQRVRTGLVASGFVLLSAGFAQAADPIVQGMAVRSWGYQLQNASVADIARSPYDLMVIDSERDASIGGPFTPAELKAMKKKPDGSRRFVIAYISIGEAENYRSYWGDRNWQDVRNRTPLIEKENPEWEANFNVRYWEQEWQNLILNDADSFINRIMDAGFDGIYLDKVDIADDYQGKTPPGTVSSDLMIQFVRRISIVTKLRDPNFLTIAQNADGLLDDDSYRAAIDGIGRESMLYSSGLFDPNTPFKEPTRNDAESIKESQRLIDKLVKDKKLVLAVEYINKPALIQRAADEFAARGYVAYFGPRDLAALSVASVAATPGGTR
jgi:cysteinyl-tRNA synthetase, unknown class